MNSLYGHTWCDCLECDQTIEVFKILIVARGNRDPDLALALIHFSHTDETSYTVFGETYLICSEYGDILDPMYYDDDDDDPWEPEDLDGSRILRLLRG